mmetsp:Transcript_2394/g.5912  ORF Transcript_2394/g.5912 Transcript_2394/m.5912 type:complete len:251 (+) Transcript_2394:584-1336(+)
MHAATSSSILFSPVAIIMAESSTSSPLAPDVLTASSEPSILVLFAPGGMSSFPISSFALLAVTLFPPCAASEAANGSESTELFLDDLPNSISSWTLGPLSSLPMPSLVPSFAVVREPPPIKSRCTTTARDDFPNASSSAITATMASSSLGVWRGVAVSANDNAEAEMVNFLGGSSSSSHPFVDICGESDVVSSAVSVASAAGGAIVASGDDFRCCCCCCPAAATITAGCLGEDRNPTVFEGLTYSPWGDR